MPDRSRCPQCRERVSPFAAGCAVCGADLDLRRWDAGPGRLTRAGSWFSALTMGPRRGQASAPRVILVVLCAGTVLSAGAALVLSLLGVIGL